MKRPTYKCGQANAFFILSPRAASQLNLVQFLQAEKYEYSTASCASKQFTSLWNKAVDKGHSVVFIDYPVTEEVDVKTVKKFLLHTTTEEGAWYYSPRPNSFLVVEDAFMLGVKHPKRISGINKLAMRSLLHRIYQTSQKIFRTFYHRRYDPSHERLLQLSDSCQTMKRAHPTKSGLQQSLLFIMRASGLNGRQSVQFYTEIC